MSEFNFKSAICTSREQSERLLALGLKPETADMYYSYDIICAKPYYKVVEFMNGCAPEDIFPAWSLHRLMILAATPLELDEMLGYNVYDYYDNAINHIESLIKEGYFNKEYLV